MVWVGRMDIHRIPWLLGVVSTAVSVLCELARRNPQNYLPLAPQLFELLTNSSNNWMLIKLIKLVRQSSRKLFDCA